MEKQKRLFIFCDGTWQTVSQPFPTNVVKMAESISGFDEQRRPQIVFHDDGVGAVRGLHKITGGAFGHGIDDKICAAYKFLSFNYAEGDEVFLVGFSRGAYTVRSLAGMIYNAGVLPRAQTSKIREAYRLYRSPVKPNASESVAFRESMRSQSVPITALCCFDTVGALGVPNFFPLAQLINRKYKFHDTQLNRTIWRAYHAVSIDEPKKAFDVTPMLPSPHATDQEIEDVWFVGNHGSIGGGGRDVGLSNITLHWLVERLRRHGVGFDDGYLARQELRGNYLESFDKRARGIFRLTPVHNRGISDAQRKTHASVRQRILEDKEYRPKALADYIRSVLPRG